DLDHGFDRPRSLEVGARLHHTGDLAEAQHHAALLFADQHEAVEHQPHHQRDADPAQRAAATAATEQAAQAIAEVAQATAAATALGRPGITAVAAGARTFGPLAVVLAGNVPGHACSSLGARRRVRCASVYRLRVPERPWMRTDGWQP